MIVARDEIFMAIGGGTPIMTTSCVLDMLTVPRSGNYETIGDFYDVYAA